MTVPSRPEREHDQLGFAAIELAVGLALLVLPITLLVASIPTWFDRQATARAVARDVAREEAVNQRCDAAMARRAGAEAAAGFGIDPEEIEVTLDCRDGTRLPRGGTVTAYVEIAVPAVVVPGLGRIGGFRWSVGHTQPVDPYASAP